MTSLPRGVAACLAAVAVAAFPARALAQEPTVPAPRPAETRPEGAQPEDARPGDAPPPPLPAVTVQGWRLGANLYGGWDSNAVDLPGGAPSNEFGLGADGGAGRQGRFSMVEALADASRRQYTDVDGRNGWRAAAGATAGRRLTKNSVGSLAVGYRYDFTDGFLGLTDVATQLPRSTVRGLFGEGRFAFKPGRRWTLSNLGRYETLDFVDQGLVDTKTLRLRSELERQVSRLDRVGPRYEFLRTEWAPQASNIHSFLGGWVHGAESERWSFELESGASRVTAELATGAAVGWHFSGLAYVLLKSGRTSVELTLRQGVTPGYGQGRILDSTSAQASVRRYLTRILSLRLTGAAERSIDRLDPTYGTSRGVYVDAQVAARVAGRLGIVASYKYRWRDSFGDQVSGNRFGVALSSAIESTRRRTGRRGPP
jgi:hypothetical protein